MEDGDKIVRIVITKEVRDKIRKNMPKNLTWDKAINCLLDGVKFW